MSCPSCAVQMVFPLVLLLVGTSADRHSQGEHGHHDSIIRLNITCGQNRSCNDNHSTEIMEVSFSRLLQTLVNELSNSSDWDSVWTQVQKLQMYTPMPLDLLGGLTDNNSWFRPKRERVQDQVVDLEQRMRWSDVYGRLDSSSPDSSPLPSHISVECTTNIFRFPPVMCQAACSKLCPCCQAKRRRWNWIYYLRLTGCDEVSEASRRRWKLVRERMQLISPDSCVYPNRAASAF